MTTTQTAKDSQSFLYEKIKACAEGFSNPYALLNEYSEKLYCSWMYKIINTEYFNSHTECHVQVILEAFGKSMIGVGSSHPEETQNIQESAIREAIINALEKMFAYEKTEEKEKSSIPILHKPEPEEKPKSRFEQRREEAAAKSALKAEEVKVEEIKPTSHGFTPEQISKMRKFKEDFNILNDEQFLAHLKTWDKTIASKAQLTPSNIDSFLKYVDDLTKEIF